MRAIINIRLEREAVLAMMIKKRSKNDLVNAVFGIFFVIMGLFAGLVAPAINTNNVYAIEEEATEATVDGNEEGNDDGQSSEEEQPAEEEVKEEKKLGGSGDGCQESLGAIGWLVCPTTGKIAEAVDWLYEKLEGILVISPVSAEDGSPIYEIWKYCLSVTNIVFVIFLLVVIYSQITGYGITNYGIKKVLPKLIITAVLVNLSFLICSIAVDVSNVLGSGIRGVFTAVQETVSSNGFTAGTKMSYLDMFEAASGTTLLAVGAGVLAFETGAIWMLIPAVLGAIVAVATGLITIALRQAVVALLIMIAPLAIVAYILPNTEQWFKKWKQLFVKMLVFYPMFSLLFGASSLAGFAIIAGAKDGFGILLGVSVQIFPLFFSWKLMQMSGTFLSTINAKMQGLAAKPLAANRAWAESRRQASKQKHLASTKAYTPSLKLMQFMSDRKVARDEEMTEHATFIKNRGLAYNANKKYTRGKPNREAMEDYAMQAKTMQYQEDVLRHKNNMTKGLGQLEVVNNGKNLALKAKLEKLDVENMNASDKLFAETARGERIEYKNAMTRHERFEDAINAHFDDENKEKRDKDGNLLYKMHNIKDRVAAEARYKNLTKISEGDLGSIHYAAASAAQAYDTQKKIVETKMQKYFELTPPTKDVEYRLDELTRVNLARGERASENIDSIISGMRILNQRGDTDLVKKQLDNLLDKNIGGGIQLGTHASQALASFLMFEVKDNDFGLRRFGKYINLETANAYNENNRKVMDVTYDEYIKGYHDGEEQLITKDNPTGRMYAKKDATKLIEGTSLDNIERTALSNLDDSLKKVYGFDENNKNKPWDVKGYLAKREEIQTSFEPAFLSSNLKWLSGSEQMNSGIKFWTGYELKQKKDENGNVITTKDENGIEKPEYELVPVWEKDKNGKNKNGFTGYEAEVEKYYRDKTKAFLKDQTTGQVLGMRTDWRNALYEHFSKMYLEPDGDSKLSSSRNAEYERAKEEIGKKYSNDKDRAAAEKALKEKMAKMQILSTLGETGKLEQIYRTRRSGAANNAKDWWRKDLGLDDEIAINEYLAKRDAQRKEEHQQAATSAESGGGENIVAGGFDEADRAYFATSIRTIYDSWKDFDDDRFYEESVEWVEKNLDGVSGVILKNYDEYHKANPNADDYDLMEYLQKLLSNPENY